MLHLLSNKVTLTFIIIILLPEKLFLEKQFTTRCPDFLHSQHIIWFTWLLFYYISSLSSDSSSSLIVLKSFLLELSLLKPLKGFLFLWKNLVNLLEKISLFHMFGAFITSHYLSHVNVATTSLRYFKSNTLLLLSNNLAFIRNENDESHKVGDHQQASPNLTLSACKRFQE